MNPLLRLSSAMALALLLSGATSARAASAHDDAYAKLSKKNWGEVRRDCVGHFLLGFVDVPQGISNPNLMGVGRREAVYINDRGERIGIVFADLMADYASQGRAGGAIPYWGRCVGWEGRDVLPYALRGHPEPTQQLKDMFHAIKNLHENLNSASDADKAAAKASDMKDFLIVLNYAFQQERDYQRGVDYGQAETRTQGVFYHALCDRDDLLGSPILPEVVSAIPEAGSGVKIPEYLTCVSRAGPTAAASVALVANAKIASGRAGAAATDPRWSNGDSENIARGSSKGTQTASSNGAARGSDTKALTDAVENLDSLIRNSSFGGHVGSEAGPQMLSNRDSSRSAILSHLGSADGYCRALKDARHAGFMDCANPLRYDPANAQMNCLNLRERYCDLIKATDSSSLQGILAARINDPTGREGAARAAARGGPPPGSGERAVSPSYEPPSDGKYHVPVLENAIRAKLDRDR